MSITAQGGKLISGNTTLEKIYEVKEAGTNGLLCKNGCQEQAVALIGTALVEMAGLAETNLTNETAIDTALMIADTYPHHRPQETIVVIKNGLAGKYGKTYGKITTMEIMRWMKEYDEIDRADFFEKRATQKPKSDWKDMDEELIRGILGTPTKEVKQPERKKNEGTEIAQQWLKDFDKGAKEHGGTMFIEISLNGEMVFLNVDEYLQYRLNQTK